jgi:hypothetical protein
MMKLTREELIGLVEKLLSNEDTEEQDQDWLALLARNVPHPHVSDLIYWNEQDLSAEEIVDQALAWRPVELPEADSN